MEEYVFNIWFIIDIGTDLSSHCIIRPYNLKGSDEEKLKVLHTLAETDYKSGNRTHFSERCEVAYSNITAKGYAHISVINTVFENYLEFFVQEAEKLLPPQIKFTYTAKDESQIIKQVLPQNPLYILTFLFENEYGEMKPYTTEENKNWIQSEKLRLNVI